MEKIQYYREEIKATLDTLNIQDASTFKEVAKIFNLLDIIFMMLQIQEMTNKTIFKHVDDLKKE